QLHREHLDGEAYWAESTKVLTVRTRSVDPNVKSVEGSEDPKLEEKRRLLREPIQGMPLPEAERKFLEKCQRNRTKRQINLGKFNLSQDQVPCIFVTVEKEQIVVWRGKNYNPSREWTFHH
ncbi:hypothetical protein Golob_016888, partial [Gossypium lobatum]|nr:hypothetical protein [Gossypium lobatum]